MSSTGTPSVMAITVLMPASTASRMASAVKAGGTKIIVASAPVFSTASIDGVEDRQALDRFAAFAGRDAADHLGAVFQAALGVELPDLAGDSLADDAGVFVDQDAHGAWLRRGANRSLGMRRGRNRCGDVQRLAAATTFLAASVKPVGR